MSPRGHDIETVEQILRLHQFKKWQGFGIVCKSGCLVPTERDGELGSEVEARHQAAMLEEASA